METANKNETNNPKASLDKQLSSESKIRARHCSASHLYKNKLILKKNRKNLPFPVQPGGGVVELVDCVELDGGGEHDDGEVLRKESSSA